MKIGVIGAGVVGGTLVRYFREKNFDIKIYDPQKDFTQDVGDCDVVFIAVPVPTLDFNKVDGQDTSILEESILRCNENAFVIVRSTVLPGTCDSLAKRCNRRVHHMPEFLTERRAFEDFKNLPVTIGINEPQTWLKEIFLEKPITWTTNLNAEIAKYTHNCFGALKVTFFNIIKDLCEAKGANYDDVLSIARQTGFIEKEHTRVPGPDGKYGFGGTCFPKDTKAFAHLFGNEDGCEEEFRLFRYVLFLNEKYRAKEIRHVQHPAANCGDIRSVGE